MDRFRWLPDRTIPQAWDLRERGWALVAAEDCAPASCPILIDAEAVRNPIHGTVARAATIVLGLDDSAARASALAQGFGDAAPSSIRVEEIEQRALRLVRSLEVVPRRRRHGPLDLDLVLRDGLIGTRRIGLHPREFSLLWRLARQPGRPVSAEELIAEVWKMNFRPETNSLAVHVCRLRAKLASAGLPGVIGTTTEGGYFLSSSNADQDMLAGQRRIAEGGRVAPLGAVRKRLRHDT